MNRRWRAAAAAAAVAAAAVVVTGVVCAPVIPAVAGTSAPARAAAAAPTAARAAAGPTAASVVVLGVPGLRWDDVSAASTPNLWRLAGSGSVGSLSIRSARPVTCPIDGWLSLGAGNRARGPVHVDGCPTTPATPPTAADRAAYAADNDRLDFDAKVFELGRLLSRAGRCTTTVGAAAQLVAPAPQVRADRTSRATYTACPLTTVEVDALVPATDRAREAAEADAEVGVVDQARPPGSVLIVVGLSEVGFSRAHQHLALVDGPGFRVGQLVSPSTRRAPFVQLIDVAPTVLSLLGVPASTHVVGQVWRSAGGRSADLAHEVARLVDADRAALAMGRLVASFFTIVVAGQALLYFLAFVALRRTRTATGRSTILTAARVIALAAAGSLGSTYLANVWPWWRADHPLAAVLAATAVADALVLAIALGGPWRRTITGSAAAVCVVTFAVIGLDLVTGARLQLSSLAGYSPIVAGRFAGIGNVAFGVFAAAALLAAAFLSAGRSRASAAWVVAAFGVVAVVLDGAPQFGSDFGGVIALVPSFVVLGLWCSQTRVSWQRVTLAMLAAVVVVSGFALLDYSRPPAQRTHLGRFVGQVLDGGAATIVRRKLDANFGLLTHSVLTLMVPLVVAFVLLVLLRPWGGLRLAFEREPHLRHGLFACLIMGLVGFAVNDSGIAVPAMAMTVAIPVAIACSVAALQDLRASPDPPE